jgi:hypothetical protein
MSSDDLLVHGRIAEIRRETTLTDVPHVWSDDVVVHLDVHSVWQQRPAEPVELASVFPAGPPRFFAEISLWVPGLGVGQMVSLRVHREESGRWRVIDLHLDPRRNPTPTRRRASLPTPVPVMRAVRRVHSEW